MGNPINGNQAKVMIGANQIANLDTWSISHKIAMAKTTSFGDTSEVNTPTLKNWTAKFDGRTDPGDTLGQLAIFNAPIGTKYTFKFYVDSDTYWSGDGYIASMDPKASASGMNEVAFTVECAGDLTFTAGA